MNYKEIVKPFIEKIKPQSKELRLEKIAEEYQEMSEAYFDFDDGENPSFKVYLAKEICDVIYVTVGGIIEGGFCYTEKSFDLKKNKFTPLIYKKSIFSEERFNYIVSYCEALADAIKIKDLKSCFLAVHESNMKKLINPVYENGKLQKGPDYVEPDLSEFV